jgi:hypothetical protein
VATPQLENPPLLLEEASSPVNYVTEASPDEVSKAEEEAEESVLCVQLMSVSAGMVGVCLTVLGVFKLLRHFKGAGSLADDLVAIDSLLFVAVCILSYGGIRTASRRWQQRLERAADLCFLFALALMAVICGIIAWAIA